MRTGNFAILARRFGFRLDVCFMNTSLNDRHEPVKWRTRNNSLRVRHRGCVG